MAKSRLGKGLGALFPTIPEETAQPEETPTVVARPTAAAASPSQATLPAAAVSGQRRTHAADRNGQTAANGLSGRLSDMTVHSKGRKGTKEGRVSIPQWNEVVHPSDMFFSSTESAAAPGQAAGRADRKATAPVASKSAAPSRPVTDDVSHETSSQSGSVASSRSSSRSSAKTGKPAASASAPASTTKATSDSDSSEVQLKEVSGAYLAELAVDDITPNAHQPRTIFDDDELHELAESITEVGVLQPIVVRKIEPSNSAQTENADTDKQGATTPTAHYELIMGERRLRASRLAGRQTVPAIIRTTDDTNMLRDALLENLHRVQLNPLEEAAAYEQMIQEFGLTQERLAQSVSKSRPQIANTLRLLQLPAAVQKRVASGVLSAGHARALLGLATEAEMVDLATRIVAEGLSVRTTEELVALSKGTVIKHQTKRRQSAQTWVDPDLQQRLGDRFDTKVSIRGSEKKGRIEIVYASPEDLRRITSLLVDGGAAVGVAGDQSAADQSDGWV